MHDAFRIGIVGTGRIGGGAHLPAALACPGTEVNALVDPCLERCEALLRQFGIQAKTAVSVGAVLGEVDGVVIATPNNTHASIALECLKAGVHVLVEKPLAVTVAEGEAMVHEAAAQGVVLVVGYSTRFRRSVGLMHDLIQSGYFGTIRRFVYQFGSRGGWDPLSGYILDRGATGGGVLVVTGTHFVDRMLYWFGVPTDCAYEDDSLGGPEANVAATFTFSSFEGTVRLSKTTALPVGFAMETDEGIVYLKDSPDEAPILFQPRRNPHLELVVDTQPAARGPGRNVFLAQMENFVGACRGTHEPMVSGAEGVASLRLLEKLYACRKPMKADWSKTSDKVG